MKTGADRQPHGLRNIDFTAQMRFYILHRIVQPSDPLHLARLREKAYQFRRESASPCRCKKGEPGAVGGLPERIRKAAYAKLSLHRNLQCRPALHFFAPPLFSMRPDRAFVHCQTRYISPRQSARESHSLWQGKIFTVEQFKAVCGYGEPSNPDHIYSYNCRHTHYPYWPGISEPIEYQREPGPFTINGRQYTYYEATQKQRAMERQIRALKREVNAGGDKATLGSEIRQRTREYKAFSDACGIREKLERLHVLGYDRSTVARVQKAVKIEDIRKLIKSDAITKKVNVQKQNRHILGSPGYIEGRSYIYGDVETAQALVDRYHGTGTPVLSKKQKWTNKEVVETNSVIGRVVDPSSGEISGSNRIMIHYSLTGTHVVPTKRG